MYNLFLDDERLPQSALQQGLIDKDHDLYKDDSNWVIVRDFDEFREVVEEKGIPSYISFDHDLAEINYSMGKSTVRFKEKTGYDCAIWFHRFFYRNKETQAPKCQVHSASEYGKPKIQNFLESVGWLN